MSIGIVEKRTPIPKVEESAMDVNPSNTDLVMSKLLSPLIPSFIAPSIVIDPMQNIRNAVINPSLN